VLDAYTVSNTRTLEMKISDSGPADIRIDPHILTEVRNDLVKRKRLIRKDEIWFHRAVADPQLVADRLAVLKPLHKQTAHGKFALRLGQTLEIAIQRALEVAGHEFVGAFLDLDEHDDSTLYKKEEPPLRFSGARMPGDKRFDFLQFHPTAGRLGIEAKNIREWMYPRRQEIRDLLLKALSADAIPVLIARRIPYVTFRLLRSCGALLFENFNQLYPAADAALAMQVQDKDLLGYHDVRVGNDPNPRLLGFVGDLATTAEDARERFEQHKDLLTDFGSGEMSYASFAARVRRRESGRHEDADEEEPDQGFDPDDMDADWEPDEPWG
jgi:hypothetical protein